MYKLTTPNKSYNGNTAGVKFLNGIGYTEDENIKDILINDFGYTLEDADSEVVSEYEKLSWPELRALCIEKGIMPVKKNKEQLIKELQQLG